MSQNIYKAKKGVVKIIPLGLCKFKKIHQRHKNKKTIFVG